MSKKDSKWIDLKVKIPKCCDDILFTDGEKVYLGFLENYLEEEDLVFYSEKSGIFAHWPDNIRHWMPLPKPSVNAIDLATDRN